MKLTRVILTLSLTFCVGIVLAQNTEQRNVNSFNEIRVSNAITIYLKSGSKESVKVVASGIDLDEVLTDVSGSKLKIHLDDGNHRNISVKVYVTYKTITEISASSASEVFSENVINGDYLNIYVSSAADVELSVAVNKIEASASSSGDMELKGSVKTLDAKVSSAGGIDAFDLSTETAIIRASSAGSAKVNASKEIDARASSGGSIRYKGNPDKSQTDSSSGGSVRKSN